MALRTGQTVRSQAFFQTESAGSIPVARSNSSGRSAAMIGDLLHRCVAGASELLPDPSKLGSGALWLIGSACGLRPQRYHRLQEQLDGWEVRGMERQRATKKRVVDKNAVKRFAARSTEASAQLERRSVPAGYVRSAKVEQFLAERQPQV
jgi:hypothetical protein